MTISQVSLEYGVSLRMLRYYEQLGLLNSRRNPSSGAGQTPGTRTYDETAVRRLQQIILLRKLRLPVKQITVILDNPDAARVIEIFRENIAELKDEIQALSVVKSILENFASQIERMTEIRLDLDELTDSSVAGLANSLSLVQNINNNQKEKFDMMDLMQASEQLNNKTSNVRVLYLPPMTFATYTAFGDEPEGEAIAKINDFVNANGLLERNYDLRHFGSNHDYERKSVNDMGRGYQVSVSIPDGVEVREPYVKRTFKGGMYAAINGAPWEHENWHTIHNWLSKNRDSYLSEHGRPRTEPFDRGMGYGFEEVPNYRSVMNKPAWGENDYVLLHPIYEMRRDWAAINEAERTAKSIEYHKSIINETHAAYLQELHDFVMANGAQYHNRAEDSSKDTNKNRRNILYYWNEYYKADIGVLVIRVWERRDNAGKAGGGNLNIGVPTSDDLLYEIAETRKYPNGGALLQFVLDSVCKCRCCHDNCGNIYNINGEEFRAEKCCGDNQRMLRKIDGGINGAMVGYLYKNPKHKYYPLDIFLIKQFILMRMGKGIDPDYENGYAEAVAQTNAVKEQERLQYFRSHRFAKDFSHVNWEEIETKDKTDPGDFNRYKRIIARANNGLKNNPKAFGMVREWLLDDTFWTAETLADNERVFTHEIIGRFRTENTRLREYLNGLKIDGIATAPVFKAIDEFNQSLTVGFAALNDRNGREKTAEYMNILENKNTEMLWLATQICEQSILTAEYLDAHKESVKKLAALTPRKTHNVNLQSLITEGEFKHGYDGTLTMQADGDHCRLSTAEEFNAPLKITLRAKTDSTNIRVCYGTGQLILNWECNKSELRLTDVTSGAVYGFRGCGYIRENEYADIEWVISRDFMALVINNELRYIGTDFDYVKQFAAEPNFNFSAPVKIYAAWGSKITVEKMTVTEL
jgi:DNA-binding transcriptional MerR regulator